MSFDHVYPLSHLLPEQHPPDVVTDPTSCYLFLSFFKTSTSVCVHTPWCEACPGVWLIWWSWNHHINYTMKLIFLHVIPASVCGVLLGLHSLYWSWLLLRLFGSISRTSFLCFLFPLILKLNFLFFRVGRQACMWTLEDQLQESVLFFLPCGFKGLNSGCLDSKHLSTETSHQPCPNFYSHFLFCIIVFQFVHVFQYHILYLSHILLPPLPTSGFRVISMFTLK